MTKLPAEIPIRILPPRSIIDFDAARADMLIT
jgi:hypothetical protein